MLFRSDDAGGTGITAMKVRNLTGTTGDWVPYATTYAWRLADSDGTRTVSVLRQRLTASPVTGQYYAVGTLSRVYPPARCPSLYDPAHLGSGEDSKVPYQFRSGMLNSAKSFGFRYGYVEARVRMPRGFALWPALWLREIGRAHV